MSQFDRPDFVLEQALPGLLQASTFLRHQVQGRAARSGFRPDDLQSALALCGPLAGCAWTPAHLTEVYQNHLRLAQGSATPLSRCGQALRRTRSDLMVGLLLRDGLGWASLTEITLAMTALAELAVTQLLDTLAPTLADEWVRQGKSRPQTDLIVLAMGKAGAAELNVSSDLDLIFVYHTPPQRDGEAQRFCDRLGQSLIKALSEVDADGFVFRVDMRLRPHGDSGPLSVSMAMLEEYWVREGREWERFAWAKSRVISQAVLSSPSEFSEGVTQLESMTRAFVYRKYLDLGALDAIVDLNQRILTEAGRRNRDPTRLNIKLGRGGIREIEFLAQTFCIMRGGRDQRLQLRGTQEALRVLAQVGILPQNDADGLLQHYVFLRRLEHALQYRDDAQTHELPNDPLVMAQVSTLLQTTPSLLQQQLTQTIHFVSQCFDRLLKRHKTLVPLQNPTDALEAVGLWQEVGFRDPLATRARVEQWLGSARWRIAPPEVTRRLRVLLLACLAWASARHKQAAWQTEAADALLGRWMQLMDVIARRGSYLTLLVSYPHAHERVLALLASGGWGSQYLSKHPVLLDELIDGHDTNFPGLVQAAPEQAHPGWAESLWVPWRIDVEARLLACGSDVERQMNLLRDAYHAQVFHLLLADLDGILPLEALADHLSALADATVQLALEGAWRALAGTQPDRPPLLVLAYGKLGGRELGYGSDLDIGFVYDDGGDAETQDQRARICAQWVHRLMTWLTANTSSGSLFELDLRLRPNGDAGLLVVPWSAFERYHRNADGRGAWLWETQALTRARVCAGNPALAQRLDNLRAHVLVQPRHTQDVLNAVIDMRRRMLESHRHADGLFDLKQDRGGMIDLEFCVQTLILGHARQFPVLLENRGNTGLLVLAAQLGLVPVELVAAATRGYHDFRQLQHAARLNGQAHTRLPPDRVRGSASAIIALWRFVMGSEQPI